MQKKTQSQNNIISSEIIQGKILFLRCQKVMLDKDLASLYGVETRILNKAVSRHPERFPADFAFRLNKNEFKSLMFHFGTSNRGGTRKPPRVFTEHGILMLSSVLNSKKAAHVNIQIMRTFAKIREMMTNNKMLREKIEKLEKKYDHQFKIIFETIKQLIDPPVDPRNPIGFHPAKKEEK